MATDLTPNGYVYPLGDDPIRNGDNVIAALAGQLGPRLIMQGSPSSGTTWQGAGSLARVRITFPEPFDSIPIVGVTQMSTNTSEIRFYLDGGDGLPAGGVSATEMRWRLVSGAGDPYTSPVAVKWWAIGVVTPPAPGL